MDAGNYQITITNADLFIKPYVIQFGGNQPAVGPGNPTLSAVEENKIYDGNIHAVGSVQISGLFEGDSLTVGSEAPIFSDSAVGNNKRVIFNGLVFYGDSLTLANYDLSYIGSSVTTQANIYPVMPATRDVLNAAMRSYAYLLAELPTLDYVPIFVSLPDIHKADSVKDKSHN